MRTSVVALPSAQENEFTSTLADSSMGAAASSAPYDNLAKLGLPPAQPRVPMALSHGAHPRVPLSASVQTPEVVAKTSAASSVHLSIPSEIAACVEENDFTALQSRRGKLEAYRLVCSEVVPQFLYVAGVSAAQDKQNLTEAGITHVLNCAGPQFPNYHEADPALTYMRLDFYDNASEDIMWFTYPTLDFIETARRAGGRVLLHCAQGVSRSCSLAIAWLMFSEGCTYQQAYSRVRAARPVCAPNAGFMCSLLEWQKRREQTAAGAHVQLIYRIAYHSILFPDRLLLKLCMKDGTRETLAPTACALDKRTCCLVLSNTQHRDQKPAVYVWQGQKRRPGMFELAEQAAAWMHRYEQCASTFESVEEGAETPDFLSALSTSDSAAQCIRYSDLDEAPASQSKLSIQQAATATDSFLGAAAVSEQADAASTRVYECMADSTDDPQESDSGYHWEQLHVYDDQDLQEDRCVLVLSDASTGHLWAGEDFVSGHVSSGDLQAFAHTVSPGACEFDCDLDKLELSVETPGQESEEFWSTFEAGF